MDIFSNSCNICFHAKQSRNSLPLSHKVSSAVFYLVHCDVCGPYNQQSTYGSSYLLTIVDDHSRTTWIYLLSNKSNVRINFEHFFKLNQTQFNKTIKSVRTDNITKFLKIFFFFLMESCIKQLLPMHRNKMGGRMIN